MNSTEDLLAIEVDEIIYEKRLEAQLKKEQLAKDEEHDDFFMGFKWDEEIAAQEQYATPDIRHLINQTPTLFKWEIAPPSSRSSSRASSRQEAVSPLRANFSPVMNNRQNFSPSPHHLEIKSPVVSERASESQNNHVDLSFRLLFDWAYRGTIDEETGPTLDKIDELDERKSILESMENDDVCYRRGQPITLDELTVLQNAPGIPLTESLFDRPEGVNTDFFNFSFN